MIAAMKYLLLLILSALVLSFAQPQLIFAQENEATPSVQAISYQGVNPADGYQFLFKRLKENIWLMVLSMSSDAKADYYLNLIDNRLSELKYTVDKKDISNIETVSKRYAATAGQATNLVEEKNLSTQKQTLIKKYEEHIQQLKSMQAAYENDELKAGWRFLEDDINSLKSYLAQLRD